MTEYKVKTISVHELKKRLDSTPNLCIIDVREDHEWQEQHIPWALHIPKDQVSDVIHAKIPDYNCPIYLHCRGGVRSVYAANCLLDLGYKDVYSVEGGIIEWEKSGDPIKKA